MDFLFFFFPKPKESLGLNGSLGSLCLFAGSVVVTLLDVTIFTGGTTDPWNLRLGA